MLSDPAEISSNSWEQLIYDIHENSIIGQRLGISYMQSNEEFVTLNVNNQKSKLYQSSMGLMAISGVVWDAGFCLSDFLVANQMYTDGIVLDIGCGTGVCGIAALLLGSTSVTFTDLIEPPSLDDNLTQLSDEHRSRARFVPFDWSVEVVCPQLVSPSSLSQNGTGPLVWDTVLCSDLLYDQKVHDYLIRTLRQIHFKNALFAYKRRHDTPEKNFFQMLSLFCTIRVAKPDSFQLRNLSISSTSGLFIVIATRI